MRKREKLKIKKMKRVGGRRQIWYLKAFPNFNLLKYYKKA